jgi:hypothetical protein
MCPRLEWPSDTDLDVGDKGVINLTAQHPAVQELLRKSFLIIFRDLVLIHAYLDLTRKSEYIKKALIKAAAELGLETIIFRLEADWNYAQKLSATVLYVITAVIC